MTNSIRRLFNKIWVFAFFLLLSIIITWPLILHMQDRVPGWFIIDNYEYLWKMWWFKHAIFDLHINPLFAPNILYPSGFPLAYAEITPLHTVIGLPLTLLFGEVVTYNLFALASFVISGWATYLLVHKWTQSTWAALFAGILIVLNPYHYIRYGGILPLLAIEGIPVFLLGLESWILTRKFAWITVTALGYAVAAWASIYYAFGLLILGPCYIIVRLAMIHRELNYRKTVTHLIILALLVIGATVPLALPYLSLRESSNLEIPLEDTDYWSASISDYLVPTGLSPIWGNWVIQNVLGVPGDYPQIALEFVLTSGYVALLFASYGAFKGSGKEKKALLVFTGVALVLSLGPTFHMGRHPLVIPAPQAVIDHFNQIMDSIGNFLPSHESYSPLSNEGLTLPLPALFLRWIIEPLKGMRGWNRFAVFVNLGISLLAGLGFAYWINNEIKPKTPHSKIALAPIVFIVLAAFELWPRPVPLQPIEPRPVDLWLVAQPDQGSIMELPLTSALNGAQLLYTRYHGKPIAFAYGTYLPYWYRQQYPELERCPQTDCIDRLRSWGVAFVLLNLDDPSGGPRLEAELNQSPALERIIKIDDYIVYRLLY
jgi:hypothetical protein